MKNLSEFLLRNGLNVEWSYVQNYKNGFEDNADTFYSYMYRIEQKLEHQKIITDMIKNAIKEFGIFKRK